MLEDYIISMKSNVKQNSRRCYKKREKFKVLGIEWNLIEMLFGMCINGFEAWKFQNACRCHGNRKHT
jgi:hypothetical protein